MLYLLKNKENAPSALIFGALFSVINLTGKYLENNIVIETRQYIYIVLNAIVLTFVIGELYLRIQQWYRKRGINDKKECIYFTVNDRKYYWICVLLLCLAYLPVYLAYYPGLFAYDVDTQIPQFFIGYSKHHNLIHTLYLHFFYYFIGGKVLQSYTAGIAWASVVQMIFFSMMVSYIHLFLRRIQTNFKIRAILIGLSAILPYFSVLSVSMTKDVFFTGFVGVVSVCLYYWEMDTKYYQKKSNQIVYILAIVGTILFRNNGIYAILLSAFTGIICIGIKNKNFRYIGCTLTGILISLVISAGLEAALSAKDGSKNEMFSIPYQQLAHVYHTEYDNLNQEEKNEIIELIPDVEKYKPHISDPIKANAIGAYNKKQLLTCYIKLFFKYPMEYAEAFLLNNLGYLYVGDTTHAEIYGADLQERSGYLLTDTKAGFEVEHTTYFRGLEGLYETLFSGNEYQNIYALAFLCSPATYFWMVVLLFFYAVDLRRICWIQFSFVFGLIITVLAGPCCLIRYAFPYIICLPSLGATVLGGATVIKEEA